MPTSSGKCSPTDEKHESSRRKRTHASTDATVAAERSVVARHTDNGEHNAVERHSDDEVPAASHAGTPDMQFLGSNVGSPPQIEAPSASPFLELLRRAAATDVTSGHSPVVAPPPQPQLSTIEQIYSLLQLPPSNVLLTVNPNTISLHSRNTGALASEFSRGVVPQVGTYASTGAQPPTLNLLAERIHASDIATLLHQERLLQGSPVSLRPPNAASISALVADPVAGAVINPALQYATTAGLQTIHSGHNSQRLAAGEQERRPRTSSNDNKDVFDLALSSDDQHLSEYQRTIRRQLEFFASRQDDVETNTRGRKKKLYLRQIGLRCRHCSSLPACRRGVGAVYYPAKLTGVYQAAQNMASSHLSKSCSVIPEEMKQRLLTLRDRRETASGGKQYWVDSCRLLGLYETPEGIWLRGIGPPVISEADRREQNETVTSRIESHAVERELVADGGETSPQNRDVSRIVGGGDDPPSGC